MPTDKTNAQFLRNPVSAAIVSGTMLMGAAALPVAVPLLLAPATTHAACNPCSVKKAESDNPCAAKACNPCAAKACNPCAAKACNPCAAKACNPCAAKACNPCAAKACNPCAAKACNPCAVKACNPCAAKACNPCAAKACNPCAANACTPCGAAPIKAADFVRPKDIQLDMVAMTRLISKGETLWNDTSVSSNGLSCQSCHQGGGLLNATFAEPYPHTVAMPKAQAGVEYVDVDEMVNFCMVAPMQAKPMEWNSEDLLALSAYALELQTGFNPCAAKPAANPCNPCAAKACNPCAAKACNPCAAKACNPCAAKACNPCAAKACNPCAAKACNPCAAKACNPCAAKACNPCAAKACNPCNPCAAKKN